ncbi:MAG: SAM-dependent methyltransferase [Nitrospira sp.]|nr:SAM-dependent methyltransferase [Nitrospira sp.]
MSAGHPELIAAIASEVTASGPIPFARFMELALYHPQFGYYMRSSKPAAERIGKNGDFYTSSDVHPILGQALAKQAEQMDRLLGQPSPFTIAEMGPGKGLLARHILATAQRDYPSLFHRLRYVLIERSPAMREAQCHNLAPWLDQPDFITWIDDLAHIPSNSLTGLFFSNELVDSFPVHRIQMTAQGLEERCVDYQNGRFSECLKPLSSERLAAHLRRIVGSDWAEGYRTEINLHALDWMAHVAQRLARGFVLTIDYGHTAQDLYGPDRKRGTFLCYRQHAVHEDPFLHVGEQDMTTHVDFSSLATAGEDQGLQTTGFTNQMSFLMGLGVEQMLAGMAQNSPESSAAIQLLRPNGMGTTFKVLIQHKAVPNPTLDGLHYQPFFRSALSAQSAA